MASASFVIVHAVLWTKHRGEDASRRKGTDAARALRYLIVIVLMALPPFGITGWAHPLTAAGVLFPGWGWLRWTGQGGGARADFFANPVVEVDGVRIAPLICYEQLILWPVLQSMLYSPEVIVAVGNGWWTENTSIVAIEKASVLAWARLFGLPIVMAFNT